mmetsp:Transcript_106233/g.327931  ORF Transcript_106233/g.327931 Transcript_106233/m.327931 type:complete len:574 (+) Transcript_106233:348-2069(+)
MLHELLHPGKGVLNVCSSLHGKPLVDDQRIAGCVVVEGLQSRSRLRPLGHLHQVPQRGQLVRHALPRARLLELRGGPRHGGIVLGDGQVGEADVAKGPPGGIRPVDDQLVVRPGGELRVALLEVLRQRLSHCLPDGIPCHVEAHGVGGRGHRLHERGLGGEDQGIRKEAEVLGLLVCEDPPQGLDEARRRLVGCSLRGGVAVLDRLGAQDLRGLPPVEGVGVVGRQEGQVLVAVGVLELDRRGEVPQQGWHGLGGKARELEGLLGLRQLKDFRGHDLGPILLVEEPDNDRNEHRLLPPLLTGQVGLAGADLLLQCQLVGAARGVPVACNVDLRRAGLQVPLLELGQIAPVGVRHGRAEVVAGHRGAVVPLEVQVHAFPEAVPAKERLVHADDLRALAVDGGRVEVVHGNVALRSDGVGHGAAILGELPRPQEPDLLDALHCRAAHVAGELLVSEDGEALLQRQLEPVLASHPVPGPVVEILVTNHALDALIVVVRGRVRPGKRERGVEDVETLVLHGTHVEVVDGDHIVDVEVVLEPEALLIPLHRVLEGHHGVVQLVHIRMLREDRELHVAA